MWPVLLGAGALVVGVLALLSDKEQEKRYCWVCGKEVKDDMIQCFCDECRVLNISTVEVYPDSYHGNKYKPCIDVGVIEARGYRDREDVLIELKMRAKRLGCDVVHDVAWDKSKDMSGNYIYTRWSAKGIAAQRKPSL